MAKENPTTDVAEVEAEQVAELVEYDQEPTPLSAYNVWDRASETAWIDGYDLEKDKDDLVGVPFIITRVVYREGKFRSPASKEVMPKDYVSVELVTAPPDVFEARVPRNRKRYVEEGLPVETPIGPNEQIVINDSSTGIKRQITWWLHRTGRITLSGDVSRDFSTLSGSTGESVFDQDPDEWAEGTELGKNGVSLLESPLGCKRGLRFSKYENDWTPEGKTFYLA